MCSVLIYISLFHKCIVKLDSKGNQAAAKLERSLFDFAADNYRLGSYNHMAEEKEEKKVNYASAWAEAKKSLGRTLAPVVRQCIDAGVAALRNGPACVDEIHR